MNQTQRDRWIAEVIHFVLIGLARQDDLNQCLIFKGARILNVYLKDGRESLDLDSNIDADFAISHPDLNDRKLFLQERIKGALQVFFEEMNPVRFTLQKMNIEQKPTQLHPLGWTAFEVHLGITDASRTGTRNLPSIEIDIAAPEDLGPNAVQTLDYHCTTLRAYALHRIAGEKLRAFLSTLPTYRAKVKKPGDEVRVKDLHDLARILKAHPISDSKFWSAVGREFCLACKSRYVDCLGLPTFLEDWSRTQQRYQTDATLNHSLPFMEVEHSLRSIVQFLEDEKFVPFAYSIPSS